MQSETLLTEYAERFTVCGDFAEAYFEEQDDVVLKVGLVEGQDLHCYVYDRDRDLTVDATLEQFAPYNEAEYQNDVWIGDYHPHLEELGESEDLSEYNKLVGELFEEY
jgi:hypothetical protein